MIPQFRYRVGGHLENALWALAVFALPAASQFTGSCVPSLPCRAAVTADAPVAPASSGLTIADAGRFQYTGSTYFDSTGHQVQGPNFIVVSPSVVNAPAGVSVTLNPFVVPYLPVGRYSLSVNFAPASDLSHPTAGGFFELDVLAPPAPAIESVLSAATLQPGISPGEIVIIVGTHLSGPPLTAQYSDSGLYPTSLGNTTVTLNGLPAPLLYVSPTQINAVIPFGAGSGGQRTVCVTVNRVDSSSAVVPYSPTPPQFCVPLADTSPGIFTAGQSGSGQGAILNNNVNGQQYSNNGAGNPAPPGSVITFYATGVGVWNQLNYGGVLQPSLQDGSVVLSPSGPNGPLTPVAPVSVAIGGQAAKVTYAGAAPFMVAGTLQVNAVVPAGVASGAQPLVLTIGQTDDSQQHVTVAVQ